MSIDDNTIIDDYTYISEEATIGKYVHIGPSSSNYVSCSLEFPTIPDNVKIGGFTAEIILNSFSIIGANNVILPGCIVPMGFAVATHTRLTPFQNMIECYYYDSNRNGLIWRPGKDEVLKIAKSLTGFDYN